MRKKKTYKSKKYGEGKRKSVKKQRGGFIGPLAAAIAPVAVNLISKIIR